MVSPYLNRALQIISDWWWIIIPFILFKPAQFLYLWWRQEVFASQQKSVLLELKMPREVLRPIKAMEQVFAGWWPLYDPPDWYEKWIEGKYLLSMSIETVSDGGNIHFYLRVPATAKNFIESNIFAQYPEVEISEAEDYTKLVPLDDIPNEEWDIWGCDFELTKPDVYPIKTYSQFFEPTDASKEEKRIDPLASLLEGMSKLHPGEHMWVQMRVKPVTTLQNDYVGRAKDVTSVLLKRKPAVPPTKPLLVKEAFDTVLFGPLASPAEKAQEIIPAEMRLSPGERDVVAAIENKASKIMFECYIRFIFIGKKGAFYKPNLKNVLSFFANFNTENLNGIKAYGKTITKIHKHERYFTNMLFHDSLLYLSKRRIIRQYLARDYYFYPIDEKKFVFNLEELATLFHFVGRTNVPSPMLERVDSKKSEPPSNLPVM